MRFVSMRFLVIVVLLSSLQMFGQNSFKVSQTKHTRVKLAYAEKYQEIEQHTSKLGIDINKIQIFIRAFKKERRLELWGKNIEDEKFVLIKKYRFCNFSGKLGPKRKQGDKQIPEGIYYIDRFNPVSNFFLSLGLNYPNKSDLFFADKDSPGGDIFIHGNCVTIGCIPITDDKIKELYVYAVEARNNGQKKIPVHIFPLQMHHHKFKELKNSYSDNIELIEFWESLLPVYEYFEENKQLPNVSVNNQGKYFIEP